MSSSGLLPFIIWLVPKVALGGIAFSAVMLVTPLILWVIDRKSGGPDKRKFQSLAERIIECRSTLIAHYDAPSRGLLHAERFGVANVQVSLLLGDLRGLGIVVPIFEHANNLDDILFLLSYLGSIGELAERGALEEARTMDIPSVRVFDGFREVDRER